MSHAQIGSRFSVNLSVTSIASFLPSSVEQDDSVFTGITYPGGRPTLSPIQEATLCKEQAEKQREDAETRNIVWSGEDSLELDPDAEHDDDPDYIRLPDGRYEKIDAMSPIGIRNKEGNIEAIAHNAPEQSSEVQFGGFSENVPIRLQDIVCFPFGFFFFFQFLTVLSPERLMDSFQRTRLLKKHKPFYSRPKIMVCVRLLLYTKTIFIPTSILDIAAVFFDFIVNL